MTHALIFVSNNNLDMLQIGTFEELTPTYRKLQRKLTGANFLDLDDSFLDLDDSSKLAHTVQSDCDVVSLVPLTEGFWDRFGMGKQAIYDRYINKDDVR